MSNFESRNPEGVISGSFKFKPEIDAAITEFRDLNVIIRAPEIGWLYAPANGLLVVTHNEQFRPLPSEQHLMAGEVEAAFLEQLDRSDFVYVMNPDNYIGDMSIFEIGYTQGIKKPIYARNPLDFHTLGIHDPKMIELLQSSIAIMSPTEAAQDMHSRLALKEAAASVGEAAPVIDYRYSQGVHQGRLSLSALSHIAEGAIMHHGNKVLLVEDGRWEGASLTIPGTTVRSKERRAAALQRLVDGKIGAEVSYMSHFATDFMLPKSGYKKPIDPDVFVFDDHIVELSHERLRPQKGILPTWVTNTEAETLIASGEIEPNAARLLTHYLQTAV